jgi:hypothetical protein
LNHGDGSGSLVSNDLDTKMLSKTTFKGKFKAIIFKGFNKALSVAGIFASDGQIINPLDSDHTRMSPNTLVNHTGFEALLVQSLGKVLKEETRRDTKSTKTGTICTRLSSLRPVVGPE